MAAWAREDDELHTAVRPVGAGVLHATVEGIGETGWDWHVWDPEGYAQQYGLADTLEQALDKAEQAMEQLSWQLRPGDCRGDCQEDHLMDRPAERMHAEAGLR